MFLWDSNILRRFGEGHPTLRLYLEQIDWAEMALPSVVVAEVMRGRCEFALKATLANAPMAHRLLVETQELLKQFKVVLFDENCVRKMEELKCRHKTHKRYADMMIAAMALAGNHIVVTRNQKHFEKLLPKKQLVNWIDNEPS
jgi:predicted nucleic acid-binding protein